jgi:hypothetical protein
METKQEAKDEGSTDGKTEVIERVLAYSTARELSEAELRAVAGGRCDTASPNCDAYA